MNLYIVVSFVLCSIGAVTAQQGVILDGDSFGTCALVSKSSDRGMKCWGKGVGKQVKHLGDNLKWAMIPKEFIPVGFVATQVDEGFAWDEGGSLVDLRSGDFTGVEDVKQVCRGNSFYCLLQNSGGVRCWERSPNGLLTASLINLGQEGSSVWCGPDRACALVEQGAASSLKCWNSSTWESVSPVGIPLPAPAGKVLKVGISGDSAGSKCLRVLLVDGTLWSMPCNVSSSVLEKEKSDIRDFSVHLENDCHVYTNGQLECASLLGNIELGLGESATAVHLGEGFACVALASGGVKCLGRNSMGQLGSGDSEGRIHEYQLGDRWPTVNLVGPPIPAVSAVYVAYGRSCAILGLADGTVVRCWGDYTLLEDSKALNLGMDTAFMSLSAKSACAVSVDGVTVKCWNRSMEPSVFFNDTGDDIQVLDIAVIDNYACVSTAQQGVICQMTVPWNRTMWSVAFPRPVDQKFPLPTQTWGPESFVAAQDAICKLVHRGIIKELLCWTTDDPVAKLERQYYVSNRIPVQVASVDLWLSEIGDVVNQTSLEEPPFKVRFSQQSRALAVSASSNGKVSCAILDPKNGVLVCWGQGDRGQLGHEKLTNLESAEARAVNLGRNRAVYSVSVGNSHTCARLDQGEVKCWGSNGRRELGLYTGDLGGYPGTMGDNLIALPFFSVPTSAPTIMPQTVDPPASQPLFEYILPAIGVVLGLFVLVFGVVPSMRKCSKQRHESDAAVQNYSTYGQ